MDDKSDLLTASHKNWQPVNPAVIIEADLRDEVQRNGYAIIDFATPDMVSALREVYGVHHQLQHKDGGMFYSVYSNNTHYRQQVHSAIGAIVNDRLNEIFQNYRNVLNGFVVKASGSKSGFMIHQDSTALDEFKFTALTVWIALQDTNENNGCMYVVPKSHHLSSPYRAITIQPPYKDIEQTVGEYLRPIRLKSGQALIFDQRIIHNSSVNQSGKDRLAIISGIFPENAEFITCYKDSSASDEIELHKHDENYLIEYPKFFYDCHDRPVGSEIIGSVKDDFPPIEEHMFLEFCARNNVLKHAPYEGSTEIDFISEPTPVSEAQPSNGIMNRLLNILRI
ncbi:MAG: hypothetical protein Salg2KO_03720 [Salibacteraceae bacterium]